jgi:hypothetical protein
MVQHDTCAYEPFDKFPRESDETDTEKFVSTRTAIQEYKTPIKAWDDLTSKEKNYAYYFEKAAWAGALMVPHQMCYECPPLFALF